MSARGRGKGVCKGTAQASKKTKGGLCGQGSSRNGAGNLGFPPPKRFPWPSGSLVSSQIGFPSFPHLGGIRPVPLGRKGQIMHFLGWADCLGIPKTQGFSVSTGTAERNSGTWPRNAKKKGGPARPFFQGNCPRGVWKSAVLRALTQNHSPNLVCPLPGLPAWGGLARAPEDGSGPARDPALETGAGARRAGGAPGRFALGTGIARWAVRSPPVGSGEPGFFRAPGPFGASTKIPQWPSKNKIAPPGGFWLGGLMPCIPVPPMFLAHPALTIRSWGGCKRGLFPGAYHCGLPAPLTRSRPVDPAHSVFGPLARWLGLEKSFSGPISGERGCPPVFSAFYEVFFPPLGGPKPHGLGGGAGPLPSPWAVFGGALAIHALTVPGPVQVRWGGANQPILVVGGFGGGRGS